MKTEQQIHAREYLTVLLRRRSVIAFFFGILTLMLSFYGIIAGVNKTIAVYHEKQIFASRLLPLYRRCVVKVGSIFFENLHLSLDKRCTPLFSFFESVTDH